jgi:hypothetical protein
MRAKSYVYRLPLFTRLVVFIIVAAWVATAALGQTWDILAWGALVPDEVGFATCTLLPMINSGSSITLRGDRRKRCCAGCGYARQGEEELTRLFAVGSIPDQHVPIHSP